MFAVTQDRTFVHTVRIFTPVNGGHQEETVKATFRVMPAELTATYGSDEAGIRDFLRRAVVRLDELVDGQNQAIEFNESVFEQVLSLPYARIALMTAYSEAVTKAKAGN